MKQAALQICRARKVRENQGAELARFTIGYGKDGDKNDSPAALLHADTEAAVNAFALALDSSANADACQQRWVDMRERFLARGTNQRAVRRAIDARRALAVLGTNEAAPRSMNLITVMEAYTLPQAGASWVSAL